IATYARQAARAGAKVRIISSDKDLMQLVEDGVIHLHDPMKQKDIGPAEVQEKFGVGPDKVIDVQALMGDSTDNVPGAPGIGQKTAAELIGIYGSVEELIARAAEIKQPKRREAIQNNADKIRISKELVTLKDDVETPETLESFAVAEFDPATLLGFVDQMEFRALARRVREHLARQGATPPAPAAKPAEIQIAEAAHEAPINFDAYETVSTLEMLSKWIARARAAGAVGIDVATDCQTPSRAKLVGLSLALGANEACYIPLAHKAKQSETAQDLFPLPLAGRGQGVGGVQDALDVAASLDAPPPLPLPREGGGDSAQIPLAQAISALKPLLEDAGVLKIGVNIKDDINVLARHGVRIAPYDDVMLISYTLGAGLHDHDLDALSERHLGHKPISFSDVCGSGKNAIMFDQVAIPLATRYSAEDADIAMRLWRQLKGQLAKNGMLTAYETLERALPMVLSDMERAGVRIDPDKLSRLSGDFAQRMGAFEEEAYKLAGKQFNMGSPKQIGDILFGEMGIPGGRKTKTGAWSTDADILEELAAVHPLPRVLLDWRQLSKLRSTYTETLREAADPQSKRVHTTYALAATPTGRLSSTDPNLQNIPVRTEEGRRIREAFVAAPGNVLISADYSQIELRLLAHVADIPALKKAFADGLDIHAMTASEMFGVPVAGMDPMIRRQAKAINFGIIYGISAFGLARNLGIERDVAGAYIKTYFERFPGIRDYMEHYKAYAREHGYITTIFGRRCWAASIKSKNAAERAFGERQAINAPLQGAAADIIRRAMIRIPGALTDAGLKTQMLLQVHDELVFEAPEAEAGEAAALIKRIMEEAPLPAVQLSVPITVDARSAKNWAAAH
ncbi:MAG TPA: DNA polymerase I, partial [Caulobacterales bacterium]|nr:DNA polymerase I [Caulobacterales bacterium]